MRLAGVLDKTLAFFEEQNAWLNVLTLCAHCVGLHQFFGSSLNTGISCHGWGSSLICSPKQRISQWRI